MGNSGLVIIIIISCALERHHFSTRNCFGEFSISSFLIQYGLEMAPVAQKVKDTPYPFSIIIIIKN